MAEDGRDNMAARDDSGDYGLCPGTTSGGTSGQPDAATLAGEIQALYSERERAYERLALAAHERGDAITRELAARLEGELAGIRRVALLLGFEISARGVAFRPQ